MKISKIIFKRKIYDNVAPLEDYIHSDEKFAEDFIIIRFEGKREREREVCLFYKLIFFLFIIIIFPLY
jgi:hypothetical protein